MRAELVEARRAPTTPERLGPEDEALAVWWNDGASPPAWEHGLIIRR